MLPSYTQWQIWSQSGISSRFAALRPRPKGLSLYPIVVLHVCDVFRSTGLRARIKKVASIPCELSVLSRSPSRPHGCRCVIHHHRAVCAGADSLCLCPSGEDIKSGTRYLSYSLPHSDTTIHHLRRSIRCRIDTTGPVWGRRQWEEVWKNWISEGECVE